MERIIRCKGLNISFGTTPALIDLNLEIWSGEAIGVMGPNGSGKTTLLKAILGMITPTSGSVEIFDCRCDKLLCHHRSRIGYLPQKNNIDPNYPLSVLEATMMGRYGVLGLFRRPTKKDRDICMEMLEHTGMAKYADYPIGALSGGQQQRVFISRALTQNPAVLLLDEPTTGLDMPSQSQLINTIKELHQRLGLTILFITHEINLISSFVDRIALLDKKLYAVGRPEEILTRENLSKIYGQNIHISRKEDIHYVFYGDHHA